MMADILRPLALIGSGTVSGVLFAVALSVLPALLVLPPARYIEMHRLLGANWDPIMPLIVLGTLAIDGALAFVASDAATWAYAISAVLLVGVAVVSHFGNVPINRRVKAVDPACVPADWQDPRLVWRRWHLIRVALAFTALVVNAAASVLP